MDIKKQLGAKIKNLRKDNGYSQEKLAELVNMNTRQIVRIENGESFPTADNLELIAKALNTTPQNLFFNNHLKPINEIKENIINNLEKLPEKTLRLIYLLIESV